MTYRRLIGLLIVALAAVSCGRTQLTMDERTAQSSGGTADLISITRAAVVAFSSSATTAIQLSPGKTATSAALATQYHIDQIDALNNKEKQFFADQTQWAWDLATVYSGGELPTSSIISTLSPRQIAFETEMALGYSPTPEPLPVEGQVFECNHGSETIRGNCWIVNDTAKHIYYYLFTGALSAEPNQGILLVFASGPSLTIAEKRMQEYHTEQPLGLIMVESAAWPLVYLKNRAIPPQRFIFNLETRQWLDATDSSIPTMPTKITPVAVTPTSK
ncbi:hypothetical protein [Herpetosiphon giganteus]|uniref:hypothetical protein n=1 Tax=Herpetosiphon giganteus TaxID=2029754 RepID=UPI00195DE20A|nr:hypothetical protein [Herpetosiphon giganteus]MBM7846416.1 hypothetical protein [Herpetosiphon giganteus]